MEGELLESYLKAVKNGDKNAIQEIFAKRSEIRVNCQNWIDDFYRGLGDGDVDLVSKSYYKIKTINRDFLYSRTDFAKACYTGNLEMVKFLQNLISRQLYSTSEMFEKCLKLGHLDVAEHLFVESEKDGGFPIDLNNYNGRIMMDICKNGDLDKLKFLVRLANENDKTLNFFPEGRFSKLTPFFYACCNNKLEMAKFIIELISPAEEQYYVNLMLGSGFTVSCEHSYLKLAQWIWDLRVECKDGKNCLVRGSVNLLPLIVKAAANGNIYVCRWLCEIYGRSVAIYEFPVNSFYTIDHTYCDLCINGLHVSN